MLWDILSVAMEFEFVILLFGLFCRSANNDLITLCELAMFCAAVANNCGIYSLVLEFLHALENA